MKHIKTKVVHSKSKTAWNVVGDTLDGKYKIARIPYSIYNNDEHDILSVKNKHEALEHAQFISRAFNQAFFNALEHMMMDYSNPATPLVAEEE